MRKLLCRSRGVFFIEKNVEASASNSDAAVLFCKKAPRDPEKPRLAYFLKMILPVFSFCAAKALQTARI